MNKINLKQTPRIPFQHSATHRLKPLTFAVLLTLSGTAIAADAFVPLGFLPGETYSEAIGVSADGSIVAGNGNATAFVWSNGTLTNLGALGGSYSNARAISADGGAVAGYAYTAGDAAYRAFRWTSGTGMVDLGTLGGTYSYATAISADGAAVAGYAYTAGNAIRAFRWTSGTGMVDLGTFGGDYSFAQAISADGAAVAGYAYTAGNTAYRAFRWTSGSGMVDLGTLGGTYSYATAISADGSAVAGDAETAGNAFHAFRWTSGTGIVDLGTLGGSSSNAQAISADGSAVAGASRTGVGRNEHAFRWTSGTGMVDLGTLGGSTHSYANAISADGSTVVGDSNNVGFRWTQTTGMQSIDTWLADAGVTLPSGWTLYEATAVNADGSVVVGNGTDPSGGDQAWLARVGGAGTGLITDLPAFNSSLVEAGSMAVQGGAMLPNLALFGAHHRSLLDNGLARSAKGTCAWATADAARYNDTRSELIEAGVCKDIGTTRLGLGVGQAWARQDWSLGGGAKYNGQYLIAEAANAFSNGLEASVTGYYGRFDARLDRNYMNGASVDTSTGNPDARSTALRARLEWKDLTRLGAFSLSPYAAYTRSETRLDAYTETGGGFPAQFAAAKWTVNDVRIGAVGRTALSANTDLRIGLEAARRFDQSTNGVNGQVIGLGTFSLPGQDVKQTWARATVDVDHRLSASTALTFGVNTASNGGDANWGVTAGWRGSF